MKKRSWLDTALVLFMPAAFILALAALWWTRELSRNVHAVIFMGFFIAMMAAGTWADVRREQRKDEIQIAAIRFGARWSSVPVALLAGAAGALPQFQELLVGLARTLEKPAQSMFVLGVFAAFVVQMLATNLFRAAWLHSKVRA